MKVYSLFLILSITLTLLINSNYALELNSGEEKQKNGNIICEKKNKKQTFYDVFAIYPKGSINKHDPEYNEFLDNLIESIHDVIMKTRKTYQNPKVLDELQEGYPMLNQIYDDYNKYGTVFRISQVDNMIMLEVYLNEKNVDEVRKLPNISSASFPTMMTYDDNSKWFSNKEKEEEEETICFEVDDTDDEPIVNEVEPTTTTEVIATATPEPEEPEDQKKDNIICEKKNKKETFYEIVSKYPKGDIVEDDPVYIEFVNNLIESIHDIIVKTRKTYQNPKELDRLQEGYPKLNPNRNDYDKYGTIYHTYIIERTNLIFFQAYLNEKNVEEVRKLPDISYASLPIMVNNDDNNKWFSHKKKEEDEIICFEVEENDDEVDSSITPEAQCFSIALGYPCCSSGAKVYYVDRDGEWGYENNNWCGITN